MRCAETREHILEASADELMQRDSDVGRHLASCETCNALAAAVLQQEAALRRALAEPPRQSVDDALAALRTRVVDQPRTPPDRSWRIAAAAAVAAAAVLVLLMPRSASTPEPTPPAVAADVAPPIVEDAGDANVAVFSTRNEHITVVWIYREATP